MKNQSGDAESRNKTIRTLREVERLEEWAKKQDTRMRRRSTDNGEIAYEIKRVRNVARAWKMLKTVVAGCFILAVALLMIYGFLADDFNLLKMILGAVA